jgi:predicted ATPase/DNA-binding XRE family transcriptional regulator
MDEVSRPVARTGFAEALRRLRAEAGLSQEELAERAGLSVRGLRYLERGLRHPHRNTVTRLAEALGVPATGSAELVAAYATTGRGPGPHGPPRPTGPLIGREQDLEHALRLVCEDRVRLLTVTGLGGVGKTRFALEVAVRLEQVGAVVAWVPLAAVTDVVSVPLAVANAVDIVPVGSSQVIDVLAHALEEEHVLLLDNAEQVASSASFVADLVERCPSLTVIVTSRVALGVHIEQRFPLEPLATPDPARTTDPHVLAVNPAVDMFMRRLQAVDPHYALTAASAPSVAAVVTQLEGLPLALELAAARSAALPPEAMATRLDGGLDVLASDAPDLPARHRTMRATIAWSYDLLPAASQEFLQQLAVFVDGVALTSIEALPDALTHLDALLASSLLRTDRSRPQAPRFRMHELIRSYALEQLTQRGENESARSWHAEHFLSLAHEAHRHFYGPDSATWLDRLEVEHANLRAALGWLRDHGRRDEALRLAGALSWFWYVRGHAVEGRSYLDALLAEADASSTAASTGARMAALSGAGHLAQTQGDYQRARGYLDEAITLSRTSHDQPGLAAALLACGFVARVQEDYRAAVPMLQEAAAVADLTGPPFVVAATEHHLGMIAADAHHDLPAARRHLDDSLRLYRRLQMSRFEALVRLSLADVALAGGDLANAAELARHSLELMCETGEQLGLHGALDTLACLAVSQGNPARAVRLSGAAAHLRALHGLRSWPVVQRRVEERLATTRTVLTPDEYQGLWDDGYAMTPTDALTFAAQVH